MRRMGGPAPCVSLTGTGKGNPTIRSRVRTFLAGLVPLFTLAHFTHHLLTALPVPMLPLIRDDFGLSYAEAGLAVSAFNVAYGFGQLPGGWLADRAGPRILVFVGTFGVAITGVLVGLSQTYIMMIVFLVLMGVTGGGYHPAASPTLSASVRPASRGSALGFHLVGGSASFFLAPIIAAGIASVWGWRGSFLGLSAPTALLGIVLYLLLGRRFRRPLHAEDLSVEPAGEAQPAVRVRLRHLVAFMVMVVLSQAVLFSVVAFVPLFIVDNYGVAEETGAAYLAIVYSAGLWASPLGGYLSDRLGRVKVVVAGSLATAPLVFLLGQVAFGVSLGAVLLAMGVMMYTRMPASESFVIAHTPEHRRSTIMGIYYFAGMEAGGLLAPVMGYFIDRFGFQTSFSVAAATVVGVVLVCSLFLRGRAPRPDGVLTG